MSAAAEFELALRFEHPEIDIRCETLGTAG
jgi:hypothetical protein